MSAQLPNDEEVLQYIESIPNLRTEWGITGSKKMATITFVLLNILLVVVIIGTIVYFMLDGQQASHNVSGLLIVLVLAYAVSGLRHFQLRAERAELPKYRKSLARELTGNPETDSEVQARVERNFKWESMRYRYIARMLGIAGLVIIMINTYQGATYDFARILIFDGAILIYLTGSLWNNYALKADILEVTLEERCRATIRWQTEHPGEAQEDAGDESPQAPKGEAPKESPAHNDVHDKTDNDTFSE